MLSRTSTFFLRSSASFQAARSFSTSTAADDYHTINDQIFYTLTNKVDFSNTTKVAVFDNSTKEKRYVPWDIKLHAFKHGMGILGTMTWCKVSLIDPWTAQFVATMFGLNWARRTWEIIGYSIKKIELHQDGKSVTLTPNIGDAFEVRISDIKKLENEKTFIETFEESYIFPIDIKGKKYYLHGQGQESIRHGECFRAIING